MTPATQISVRYTSLQKISIPLGTVMFAVMAAWILFEAANMAIKTPIMAAVIGLFGIWFIYLTSMGFKLSRRLSLVVTAGSEGMNIVFGSNSRRYSWDEIGTHQYDFVHRVLKVFDSSGQELLSIDGDATGCNDLVNLLGQRLANGEETHA